MSTQFSKIEAIFTEVVGEKVQVVTPENEHSINGPTVSIEQLFQCSHDYTPAPHTRAPCQLDTYVEQTFDVFVRLPKDKLITLHVSSSDTIGEIKSSIEMKTYFPAQKCRLRLLNKELRDDMTVVGSNIQKDATLFVFPRLEGGRTPESPKQVFKLSTMELAPEYNFDFTDMVDDGKTYMRGGFKYERPYGWYRFALNVVGKYEDDSWLGPNGIRTDSAVNEWPVAYHGTNRSKIDCVKKIIDEGFKIGPRDKHGPGVYTSPSLTVVTKVYAGKITDEEGKKHKFALQSRVDPKSVHIIPKAYDGFSYWISPEGGAVRAYGIISKEIEPPRSQARAQPTQPPPQPSWSMSGLINKMMSSWFT